MILTKRACKTLCWVSIGVFFQLQSSHFPPANQAACCFFIFFRVRFATHQVWLSSRPPHFENSKRLVGPKRPWERGCHWLLVCPAGVRSVMQGGGKGKGGLRAYLFRLDSTAFSYFP